MFLDHQEHYPPASYIRLLYSVRITHDERTTMRPYKIVELKLLEPLRIMADSHTDAASYFLACLQRVMGGVPIVEYSIDGDVMTVLDEPHLIDAVRRRGFLWRQKEGWKVYDPFDEQP